jgi:hypothetical protein
MKLVKLLCLVILTLVIGNVTVSNKSLDQSLTMTALAKEITTLEKEAGILEAEIAMSASLPALEQRIAEAGFVPADKILAIGVSASVVALR